MNGGDLIAVTGATGGVGGRVAAGLAARGVRLRVIVRDPARAPRLPGADIAVVSGYAAATEMRAALAGAQALFLVSARESADRVAEHKAAVDAAIAAGVQRIVYLSFLGAAADSTFTFARDHAATEELIRERGVPFTFQRQSLYADFLSQLAGADGVIRGPAGDGHVAPVTRDDVAAVAVELLTGGVHAGRTYDVTGPQRVTMRDVARELTEVSGRPVSFVDETLAEAHASRAHLDAPAFAVEGWITSYAAVAAGELDVVSNTVARLTGREPQGLGAFLRAHPETWAHLAAG